MALRKWKDKLPLGTAPFTCMSGRDAESVYQTVPVSFCVHTNSAHLGRGSLSGENAPIRLLCSSAIPACCCHALCHAGHGLQPSATVRPDKLYYKLPWS